MSAPRAGAPDAADVALIDRFRAGDQAAFTRLHARHHRALERYAYRVLGDHALAEDVVQEAFLRASRALLRDEPPLKLRAFLFTLVRNCALDELARRRAEPHDPMSVHLMAVPEPDGDPHERLERAADVRHLLTDIVALPAPQRHALIRRELDGESHEQIGRELGIAEAASRSLVHRARRSLGRGVAARSADCGAVQEALLEAFDARRRAPVAALRHVATCPSCRAFRTDLRGLRRTLDLLVPGPALLLFGGALGVKAALGSKPAAVVATGAVAVGGTVAAAQLITRAGEPSPVGFSSATLAPARVMAGAPLPTGAALVTREARVERGVATVALTCPAGHVVADLLDTATTGALVYAEATVPGRSRRALVRVRAQAGRPVRTIRILCRTPAANGSVRPGADPRARATTCARRTFVLAAPGGAAVGSVSRGQPLRVVRRGRVWARVVADDGTRGVVRTAALCPR